MTARNDMRRPTSGFTLIEILIALVIVSVGMLGIAALHMEGLKSGRSGLLRTKAVALSADLAERMRANRPGALAGDYAITAGDASVNRECADDTVGGATIACTPLQMAEHDLWLWKRQIANPQTGLPGPGTGAVISDGAAVPTYTITVAWTEAGEANDYIVQVQP